MIVMSVLGLSLGALAQLASLLASSKFAVANSADAAPAAAPAFAARRDAGADPRWTTFMRGM